MRNLRIEKLEKQLIPGFDMPLIVTRKGPDEYELDTHGTGKPRTVTGKEMHEIAEKRNTQPDLPNIIVIEAASNDRHITPLQEVETNGRD